MSMKIPPSGSTDDPNVLDWPNWLIYERIHFNIILRRNCAMLDGERVEGDYA